MSDTRIRRIKSLSLCGLLLVSACSRPPAEPEPPVDRLVALDDAFAAALAPHDLRTVGAALIEDGAVVWTGYYGEQSPGVPASSTTQFNVASITKTVATEVVLRLVEQGVLSLDEPMATEWVDPDIADDPRHKLLTPRMVLTHTTGLPNWRFMAADRKLAFEADPGARFTYSGEGFEYLATFVEKRTGRPFPELVEALVFEPLGIRNAGYSIDESNFPNIAQAFDDDGEFAGFYCYPETNYCRKTGSSTPADDLVISVDAYAAFLIAAMNGDGYSAELAADRNTVQSSRGEYASVNCDSPDVDECPVAQGYGLGWEVFDYGDREILSHGGGDWHELTVAAFDTSSRNGLIVFVNAPTEAALDAMIDLIAVLDAESPLIGMYKQWRAWSEEPD